MALSGQPQACACPCPERAMASAWDCHKVAAWVEAQGFPGAAQKLLAEVVDGEALLLFSPRDFAQFGIPYGPAVKLLGRLRPAAVGRAPWAAVQALQLDIAGSRTAQTDVELPTSLPQTDFAAVCIGHEEVRISTDQGVLSQGSQAIGHRAAAASAAAALTSGAPAADANATTAVVRPPTLTHEHQPIVERRVARRAWRASVFDVVLCRGPSSGVAVAWSPRAADRRAAAASLTAAPARGAASLHADVVAVKQQRQQRKICQHGKCRKAGKICSGCPHGKHRGSCKICSGCPHGKLKKSCATCTGCPHGKVKCNCAICSACPHGKYRASCKICIGCPHGKFKGSCATCTGCPHGKAKYNCAMCSGCPHGKHKASCKICSGCQHGKVRKHCKICGACPHGKLKRNCSICSGCPHSKLKGNCSGCPHGKLKGNCTICSGCPHGKVKYHCAICSG